MNMQTVYPLNYFLFSCFICTVGKYKLISLAAIPLQALPCGLLVGMLISNSSSKTWCMMWRAGVLNMLVCSADAARGRILDCDLHSFSLHCNVSNWWDVVRRQKQKRSVKSDGSLASMHTAAQEHYKEWSGVELLQNLDAVCPIKTKGLTKV